MLPAALAQGRCLHFPDFPFKSPANNTRHDEEDTLSLAMNAAASDKLHTFLVWFPSESFIPRLMALLGSLRVAR